jgi:hypothetical protein
MDQGFLIFEYNGFLCGFNLTTASTVANWYPTSDDCPTGTTYKFLLKNCRV